MKKKEEAKEPNIPHITAKIDDWILGLVDSERFPPGSPEIRFGECRVVFPREPFERFPDELSSYLRTLVKSGELNGKSLERVFDSISCLMASAYFQGVMSGLGTLRMSKTVAGRFNGKHGNAARSTKVGKWTKYAKQYDPNLSREENYKSALTNGCKEGFEAYKQGVGRERKRLSKGS